ncbi:MAG: histidine kinase N-terminal 7TM domain-containing protein [Lachnospiraceae bacterium]
MIASMYEVYLAIQYVGIAVLIAEILFVLNKQASRLQVILLCTATATLINFIGYLMEITSSSMETAIMGMKFAYLGKPFIALGMFFFVMAYCRVSIRKETSALLIIMHIVMSLAVFTCDEHQLFFKSISYIREGEFSHLVCEPGPLYLCYLLLMGCGTTVCVWCSVGEWIKSKTRVEKRQAVYILLMVITIAAGMGVYMSGITGGYDTTQIAYLINVVLLAVSVFRYRLFEVLTLAKEKALNDYQDGLIVVDNRDMVIYSNSLAKEIYPALATEDYKEVLEEISDHASTQGNLFYKKKVFTIQKQPIMQEGIAYGRTYKIIDVTDSYNYATRLQSDVEQKTRQIKNMQSSVIESFANMIEARDGITGQHIKHTSAYVRILINGLKETGTYKEILTDEYIATVIDVAPLHDVGKIAIMDQVLKKNDKLTEEEFDAIKTHPKVGSQIIEEILRGMESEEYIKIAKEVALYHHEKWNGTGYPVGLRGSKIPLCARIMAVADVYDALRSKRTYKESFSKEKSRQIIEEGAGIHFDPVIVQVFLDNINEIEAVV